MINKNEKSRTTEYVCTFVPNVIKWIFVLFMIIQMVLGAFWIIGNIGKEANFHDTLRYLSAVESGKIDEYMGPMYPIIIWLAKELQSVIRVPYYISIYLWQLLIAAVVMYKAFVKICKPKNAILVTGYMMSFPLLTQIHLAVLPYSLAMSLLVYLICECGSFVKKPGKGQGAKVAILWVLAGLLIPEYFTFAGILAVPCFVWVLVRYKEHRVRLVMTILIAAVCMSGVSAMTQTPGSLGRMEKTSGVAALHRFVWPDVLGNSFFWDERVKDVFSERELLDASQYPEVIDYEFGPKLQEIYGVEEANRICWQMALANLGVSTKQVGRTICKDLAWNINPILGFQVNLKNNDRTLVGWNYARLQDHTFMITKYYVKIAMISWNIMCPLGILIYIFSQIKKSQTEKSRCSGMKWLIAAGAVTMILWYTFVCSMQDYKQMMPITILWLLPIVAGYKILDKTGEQNG